MDLRIYILLFITYSFLGWFFEIIVSTIENKKLVDRGFLIGPYCPIYGWASIAMMILLDQYLYDPTVLFIMAVVLFAIIEYFTSYFMEKMFKLRWWDYSNYKFNINGRICLEAMIPFGLLGCLVMYVLNPLFINIFESLPIILLNILSISLVIIFIIDNIISYKIIFNIKYTAVEIAKDSTEEIAKKVREILLTKTFLHRRLLKAYPKFAAKIKDK